MTLEPEITHKSEPHNEGVEEYIFVNEGTLEIEINDILYIVNTEDIIFDGNKQYIYRNKGTKLVKCLVIIYLLFYVKMRNIKCF